MLLIQRIISLLLIAITVSFSGGLSIAKHYCASEVKNVSVNSIEKSCCEAVETPEGIDKAPCCKSEISYFETSAFEISNHLYMVEERQNTVSSTPLFSKQQDESFDRHNIPPPGISLYKILDRYLI